MSGRFIICLDFDGVIHWNVSKWQGRSVIPDGVIPGTKEAIQELRKTARVVVFSGRCISPDGRDAIRSWLDRHGIEVDEVCERLAAEEPIESSPMGGVDVLAKMKRNDLTSATRLYLNQAVAGATEAQRFINFNEPSNPNFGRRLRASFLMHYNQGVATGQQGDDLFWRMYHFAAGPDTRDPKAMAPGVAILGYLFSTCEVFDAP